MTDPNLLIAQSFTGHIPQQYTRCQIESLTDGELTQFSQVLNVPDLTREQLIQILIHLNAIKQEDILFVISEDGEIEAYLFDPTSTPYANLIVSTFDQLWKKDVDDKNHPMLPRGIPHKSSMLIGNILNMTERYVYGGFNDDSDITQRIMGDIEEILGQKLTRQELGTWTKVNTPYKGIRIGYSQ